MSRNSDLAGLTTVRAVGGLIPADLLTRVLAADGLAGLTAGDFHLELGVTPREAANRAWSVLSGAWSSYRQALAKLPEGDRATGLTREKWMSVLLRELDFGRVPAAPAGGLHADDRSFPVSHVAGSVPVHLLGWSVDLDRRTPGLAGAADRAPHAMVQELLNRSDDRLWGILANGSTLRLLRDSSKLVGQSYVEFDLEAMFDGEVFSDFVALYLLCHQSRFEPLDTDAGPEDCWLERWRADAVETGARALGELRVGVQRALEDLGSGFLRHPANATLRDRLEPGGDLDLTTYHRSLLRLVYRLLFLFVAEDRGLLLHPAADDTARHRYTDWFSTARLRRIATRRRGTRHSDLWQALTLVLDGLGSPHGRPELALPGLGGIFTHTDTDVVAGLELPNEALLAAVRRLCVIQPKEGGPRRAVDYRHLGAEELGGIYESLLELVPQYDPSTRTFSLAALPGNERKTTGAHYTPSSLIDFLLESSLDPLLDAAESESDPERAILGLTVCDPAAGSAHFLVAAARRMAQRLARVRSGDDEPSLGDSQRAVRDVIAHCIYGVDISPMAVELCKVGLWLEALEPGRPLGFLDHHLVCGNAIVGATPRLLADGVPDTAIKAIEGDDKATVTARRKLNARQRATRDQNLLHLDWDANTAAERFGRAMSELEHLPEDTPGEVALKEQRYRDAQTSQAAERARLAADTWCAAVVAVKTADRPAITDETVRMAAENPAGLTQEQRSEIALLAEQYQFLHWHLAFPQVYRPVPDQDSEHGWTGGFSLVLGNPPWDTLSPDAKEFFSTYEPSIRFEKKEGQQQIIDKLLESDVVRDRWEQHRRMLFGLAHFAKSSGRYRMFAPGNLGKGDFNIYRMFVETALTMTASDGWAAQVTPSGLYNGANAAAIRAELLDHCRLRFVGGLINTAGRWFPGIDHTTRFAIYVAERGGHTTDFAVAFGVASLEDLAEARRTPLVLSAATVKEQSPEALAMSELKAGPDGAITAKLYGSHSSFGAVVDGLPLRRYQREIDMGNDRELFGDIEDGLPLYEGRMIDQFDHRAKAYRSGRGRAAVWEPLPFGSPGKAIVPQWRVPRRNVPKKLGDRVDRYRVAFCDVTAPRNERSLIAALLPPGVIAGHSVPTFSYGDAEWRYLLFLGVANSFPADFLIRKKVTLHVSLSILDALPMPVLDEGDSLAGRIAPLALRLTCAAPEMTGYWNAMSEHGWCEPVPEGEVPAEALVDPAARAEARAELDALVARDVYGLTRDELSYILDQFPVLQRREVKAHGSFVTKERVLSWYDRIEQGG